MAKHFVAILMGSKSDWDVMKKAQELLRVFDVASESKVLSAHRAPEALVEYVKDAESRGCKAFIAGAGGAAHLAGVIASKTTLPVLGVPMPSKYLQGLDSLLSTVQMPQGIPVATFSIGEAGAANAALFAIALFALGDPTLAKKLTEFRKKQAEKILATTLE